MILINVHRADQDGDGYFACVRTVMILDMTYPVHLKTIMMGSTTLLEPQDDYDQDGDGDWIMFIDVMVESLSRLKRNVISTVMVRSTGRRYGL